MKMLADELILLVLKKNEKCKILSIFVVASQKKERTKEKKVRYL